MNVWWAVGIGAVVGTALGAVVMSDARASAAIGKIVQEARLPEPSFAMQLPRTAAEFSTLEALVCDCMRTARPVDPGAPTTSTTGIGAQSEDERTDMLVRCVAARLYPGFPWPPMTGDHPSATELWDTLAVIVRRQYATAACTGAPVTNPRFSRSRVR